MCYDNMNILITYLKEVLRDGLDYIHLNDILVLWNLVELRTRKKTFFWRTSLAASFWQMTHMTEIKRLKAFCYQQEPLLCVQRMYLYFVMAGYGVRWAELFKSLILMVCMSVICFDSSNYSSLIFISSGHTSMFALASNYLHLCQL